MKYLKSYNETIEKTYWLILFEVTNNSDLLSPSQEDWIFSKGIVKCVNNERICIFKNSSSPYFNNTVLTVNSIIYAIYNENNFSKPVLNIAYYADNFEVALMYFNTLKNSYLKYLERKIFKIKESIELHKDQLAGTIELNNVFTKQWKEGNHTLQSEAERLNSTIAITNYKNSILMLKEKLSNYKNSIELIKNYNPEVEK